MNVNALQEAIRERDEARAKCSDATMMYIAASDQLSEAVALLRRYRAGIDNVAIEPSGTLSSASYDELCNCYDSADAFLSRLDGAK